MNHFQYAKAIEMLQDVLPTFQSVKKVDDMKQMEALCHGWLGECYFQTRNTEKSIQPMATALELCRAHNDTEGTMLYMKNLVEVNRYLGNKEEAALWCDRLSEWFRERKNNFDSEMFKKKADIIRKGEPLNRIVIYFGEAMYEITDVTPDMLNKGSGSLKFVFYRNRISLAPCSDMVRRGRQLSSQGKFQEALKSFECANQLDPYAPEPLYDTAFTLIELNEFSQALEFFEQTEKLAPGWYNVRSYIWLTKKLLRGSLDKEAFLKIRLLEDSSSIDERFKLKLAGTLKQIFPNIPIFGYLLGASLTQLNDFAKAEEVLQEALEKVKADKDPYQNDLKTRILFALGRITPPASPKRKLLFHEASLTNGNLNCAAMAHVTDILRLN